MPFFTRPELIDDQFKQLVNTTLTLSGETNFAGVLKSKGIEIDASTGGTVSIGNVLTLDSDGVIRLKSSSSGNTATYQGESPSTITVGGIPVNTILTGKTFEDLWEELLVPYQAPTFGFFNNDISSLNQVGNPTGWTGFHNFSWSLNNDINFTGNNITIKDVTGGGSILPGALSLPNVSPANLDINTTINNNVPINGGAGYTWGINGFDTKGNPIPQKNWTIKSIYPWFYGTFASGGAMAGVNRPDPNNPVVAQSLIDSGSVVVANSNSTIVVNNFGAIPDDYIWFAIPSSSTSKLKWYVNALDNGSIGGIVSAGGNLFPDLALASIDSPSGYWGSPNPSIQYKIYVSNKQVTTTNMEFRNS